MIEPKIDGIDRMEQLEKIIMDRISREGPVTFEGFMEMALYYPGLGYYAAEPARIGKAGDFYTSPHVSALFGATLGRQMEEMWRLLGCPSDFTIVEMGAGAGFLALDLLDFLADKPVYGCITYVVIELNPASQQVQRERLQGHAGKVSWFTRLDECEPFTGCFLSNELFDALPVRIVDMNYGLMEVMVGASNGRLIETRRPAPDELKDYLDEFGVSLEESYRTEINLRMKELLLELGNLIEAGFILTVDYGFPAPEYYSPERNRGTLLAYRGHRASDDVLSHAGEQDLTAHVNFSALKKWGQEAGFQTLGFAGQGAYLVSLGIHELMPAYLGDPPEAAALSQVKQLILPQGLGETHKVVVQSKGVVDHELRGFTLRNELRKL